jgi:hypothetical protein
VLGNLSLEQAQVEPALSQVVTDVAQDSRVGGAGRFPGRETRLAKRQRGGEGRPISRASSARDLPPHSCFSPVDRHWATRGVILNASVTQAPLKKIRCLSCNRPVHDNVVLGSQDRDKEAT